MLPRQQLNATLMATALVVSMTIAGVVLGAALGPVAAEHPSDAPDYTEEANFTIAAVSPSDHYPGDQNEENASMRYWAAGEDAFHEQDASEGVYIDWIIVDADWIDYSACSTDNTAAFGIDRGNDNEGTENDDDLVQHQKSNSYRDDGISVEFFDWDDVAGEPPYMAPEDAIVAEQGENSAAGACLTMTDEPGWYRITGFMNGTVADNGEGEEPSEDAPQVEVQVESTWFYVCECDSEEEAREQLGDPPGETADDDGGAEGDTDDDADEESDEEGDEEDTEEADDETTGEEEGADEEGADDESTDDDTTDETEGDDEEADTTGDEDDESDAAAEEEGDEEPADDELDDEADTPEADGPGFGAVAALLALLAAALVAIRRR